MFTDVHLNSCQGQPSSMLCDLMAETPDWPDSKGREWGWWPWIENRTVLSLRSFQLHGSILGCLTEKGYHSKLNVYRRSLKQLSRSAFIHAVWPYGRDPRLTRLERARFVVLFRVNTSSKAKPGWYNSSLEDSRRKLIKITGDRVHSVRQWQNW